MAKTSANYVNSALAGYEARRNGYDEALLLDVNGYVAEGSGENFFVVRDGVVRTPPLMSILAGSRATRSCRFLPTPEFTVLEQPFPRDVVYIADEAFMTGTAAEVTPVRELDDRRIGEGKPGPITRQGDRDFPRGFARPRSRYGWLHYI